MSTVVDEDLWSRCKSMVGHLRHPDHIPYYAGALGGLDEKDPGKAVRVYLVDGDLVKIQHDMDFVEANNSEESPSFMPKDTIWLDVTNDPYEWSDLGMGLRTMQVAHNYIIEHYSGLSDGDVVDVEYVLGERLSPKISERLHAI